MSASHRQCPPLSGWFEALCMDPLMACQADVEYRRPFDAWRAAATWPMMWMDPRTQERTVMRMWDARADDGRGMQHSETEGCRMFSYEEARDFYNRWGAKQDWQCWYEDAAVADLIEHLSLASAQEVLVAIRLTDDSPPI